jgi:hypothetical protein
MDAQVVELLTRWTVRLAVGSYFGRVLLDLWMWRSGALRRANLARRVWTLGCCLYILHVVCAFAFFHAWSHDHAYRHTAQRTQSLTGLDWGGGLYVNYALTAWWIGDTLAWWIGGATLPYRSGFYLGALHAAFAFVVVNATVVFGPPMWKWIAVAAATVLVAFILPPRQRPDTETPANSANSRE